MRFARNRNSRIKDMRWIDIAILYIIILHYASTKQPPLFRQLYRAYGQGNEGLVNKFLREHKIDRIFIGKRIVGNVTVENAILNLKAAGMLENKPRVVIPSQKGFDFINALSTDYNNWPKVIPWDEKSQTYLYKQAEYYPEF